MSDEDKFKQIEIISSTKYNYNYIFTQVFIDNQIVKLGDKKLQEFDLTSFNGFMIRSVFQIEDSIYLEESNKILLSIRLFIGGLESANYTKYFKFLSFEDENIKIVEVFKNRLSSNKFNINNSVLTKYKEGYIALWSDIENEYNEMNYLVLFKGSFNFGKYYKKSEFSIEGYNFRYYSKNINSNQDKYLRMYSHLDENKILIVFSDIKLNKNLYELYDTSFNRLYATKNDDKYLENMSYYARQVIPLKNNFILNLYEERNDNNKYLMCKIHKLDGSIVGNKQSLIPISSNGDDLIATYDENNTVNFLLFNKGDNLSSLVKLEIDENLFSEKNILPSGIIFLISLASLIILTLLIIVTFICFRRTNKKDNNVKTVEFNNVNNTANDVSMNLNNSISVNNKVKLETLGNK